MENFDDFVEKLDGEPQNMFSHNFYDSAYLRLARKMKDLKHDTDEYLKDFKELNVDEILED